MKVQDLVGDKAIIPNALPEDRRNPTPMMSDTKVSEAGIVNPLKNLNHKRQQARTRSNLSF